MPRGVYDRKLLRAKLQRAAELRKQFPKAKAEVINGMVKAEFQQAALTTDVPKVTTTADRAVNFDSFASLPGGMEDVLMKLAKLCIPSGIENVSVDFRNMRVKAHRSQADFDSPFSFEPPRD